MGKQWRRRLISAGVVLVCLLAGIFFFFTSRDMEDLELGVPSIEVQSTSINQEGRLLLTCGSDKSKNDPVGDNQSPQVSWNQVMGAKSYVVVMIDEDTSWIHWYVDNLTKTELAQGAYNKEYEGPYPPALLGDRHNYRIEVFALRQQPDVVTVKLDKRNSYPEIITELDTAKGERRNILARGHIIGSYQHGDKTE